MEQEPPKNEPRRGRTGTRRWGWREPEKYNPNLCAGCQTTEMCQKQSLIESRAPLTTWERMQVYKSLINNSGFKQCPIKDPFTQNLAPDTGSEI